MKQVLTTLLLLFSLTLSAQTTVVTGPKKKQQTSAPAKQKQQESSPKPQQTKKTDSSQKKVSPKPNGKNNQSQAAVKQAEVKDIPISFDESTMTLHYGDQSLKMILVEGGKFVRGESKKTKGAEYKGSKKTYPKHLVCLSDYYISETCVPRELIKAVGTGSGYWREICNFINRLNSKTSMKFCIPTEAEWEFAMRGGKYSKKTKFIGTDYIDEITNVSKNEIGISDYNHGGELVLNFYEDYDYSHTYNPGLFNSGQGNNWIFYRDCKSLDQRLQYYSSQYEPSLSTPFRIVLHMKSERYREQQLTEILNLHEEQKVDLGLSVYWAGYNLSVDGSDFKIGSVEESLRENVRMKRHENFVSYLKRIGYLNENLTINQEHDPARKMWGEEWRLPTKAEFTELMEKCTWTWLCYNGVDGFYVTGPNGNSIFFPATIKKSYTAQYKIWDEHYDYNYNKFDGCYACLEYNNVLHIGNDYLEYPEIKTIGLYNDGVNEGHAYYWSLIRPVSDK